MNDSGLPTIICGPIVRAVDAQCAVLWLVCSNDEPITPSFSVDIRSSETESVTVGRHAIIKRLNVTFEKPLTHNQYVEYDLTLNGQSLQQLCPHIIYKSKSRPGFVFKEQIDRIVHGSCRRPHHNAEDGLVRLDAELEKTLDVPQQRPALMLHTGDQVYVDDVAGPTLKAINETIELLGLFEEVIKEAPVRHSEEMRGHLSSFYNRDAMLPDTETNEALTERFFGGVRKPIFTSSNAKNHLISFNEVIAMYLLVWSPTLWKKLGLEPPENLTTAQLELFEQEKVGIFDFQKGLPQVARALANIPNYMIFDDHDITDDWNLSALWEATVYEHPFSRRIVGNAVAGYLLCQAWGNSAEGLSELTEQFKSVSASSGFLDTEKYDDFITQLLACDQWDYEINRKPKVIVLDTRTQRWRSERNRAKPSGLMDWEALSQFQQKLLNQQSVIVVSPAPMFGVKLIETIQEVFTFFGRPLLVDAENWMAHKGSAEVMLNIFAHRSTPQNFTILSGDVHYSFAYDVRLKHKRSGPRIWQITSSGIKNQFPDSLLEWLDRLNRWLYSPYSPLNWFTKRRRFRVFPRLPSERDAGERLWNQSGIGFVEFDKVGVPQVIKQLSASEGECTFKATLKTNRKEQANEASSG